MNGAQSLIRTLVECGVDTCFMNPGTSEMHFVAALDAVPEMHSVLALFEGVATGAADGYGRMADRPAATLLHLGPGLGNGLANLHNARKAHTPLVNIVGDHATYHKQYDAQLESDIETVARNVSSFIRWSAKTGEVGRDAADTVAAAFGPPGQVATLVLPADISWSEGGEVAKPSARAPRETLGDDAIRAIADALRSGRATRCCSSAAPRAGNGRSALARAIADATGAKLVVRDVPDAHRAGRGRVPDRSHRVPRRVRGEATRRRAHLCSSTPRRRCRSSPIPTRRAGSHPTGARSTRSPAPADDAPAALAALADAAGRGPGCRRNPRRSPGRSCRPARSPRQTVCAALGALLPEGAIVSDEGNTSGLFAAGATAGAPPHDWLYLTGGAIGQGLPVAVGAAVACPDRRVIALESDGSAMYTLQSWWTMAREGLDVTTIMFNNGSYAVLNMELNRVGAEGAARARRRCSTSAAPISTSSRWPPAWA